jgi:hypothetical protein
MISEPSMATGHKRFKEGMATSQNIYLSDILGAIRKIIPIISA